MQELESIENCETVKTTIKAYTITMLDNSLTKALQDIPF